MRTRMFKKFTISFSIILSILSVFPSKASADDVACESMNGKLVHCPMDTRNTVRMLRNLSKTDCIEGQNWGVNQSSVWVNDGCRAIFTNGRSNNNGGGYRDENCPPGFSPSERKCTNDERRRGCRDIRLPNGLGCVSR